MTTLMFFFIALCGNYNYEVKLSTKSKNKRHFQFLEKNHIKHETQSLDNLNTKYHIAY